MFDWPPVWPNPFPQLCFFCYPPASFDGSWNGSLLDRGRLCLGTGGFSSSNRGGVSGFADYYALVGGGSSDF